MENKKYFETIKCYDYEVFNLEFHNKRVCKTIGLDIYLNEYIYAPTNELLKCKVIYSQDGVEEVLFSKYKKRDIKSFKIVYDDNIIYDKKSINRESIDKLYEKKEKADEIIIIKNNLITDTSIANIAIFDGSSWITPKTPLLYGTTRERLLKESSIFEKDISLEMLQSAKRIALLNAMIDMDVLEDYRLYL